MDFSFTFCFGGQKRLPKSVCGGKFEVGNYRNFRKLALRAKIQQGLSDEVEQSAIRFLILVWKESVN